jgi:hypothetical protein
MIATTVIGNGYVSGIVIHIPKRHCERQLKTYCSDGQNQNVNDISSPTEKARVH